MFIPLGGREANVFTLSETLYDKGITVKVNCFKCPFPQLNSWATSNGHPAGSDSS